jgi:hypothetical protein
MERFGVDDEAAFRMIVESSQQTNMKVTAVAEWVIGSATGGPAPTGPAPG